MEVAGVVFFKFIKLLLRILTNRKNHNHHMNSYHLNESCRKWTLGLVALIALAFMAAQPASAASGTWNGGSTANGNWSTTANWTAVPGSTSSTTSADTATFNAAIANTWGNSAANPIVIDSGRNLGSLIFNNANTGPYFIGSTAGNALHLTSASGVNQVNISQAAEVATETINCPLILEPPSSSTAGIINFRNVSTSGGTLNFGGGISGGTTSAGIILNLIGSSPTANTISGIISDGGASGGVSLAKGGSGATSLWILTGVNTFSGSTTISSGTLQLGDGNSGHDGAIASSFITNNATLAFNTYNSQSIAGTVSGSGVLKKNGGGTLNLSGNNSYIGGTTLNGGILNLANVSALGTNGGTLHIQSVATNQLSTDTAFGGANPVYNVSLDTASVATVGTLMLNRATAGASSGITHNFGSLNLSLNNVPGTLNVLAGPNAPTGGAVDTIAFTSLSFGNWYSVTETIAPIGANITIGNVAPQVSSAPYNTLATLALDGTSTANQIYGVISDNTNTVSISYTNQTAILKSNSSKWTFSGANTYSGNTTINGGTLALTGSSSLASPNIIVGSGAVFGVSSLNSTFTLGFGQTLSNSTSTAVLDGNINSSSGNISLTYTAGIPAFMVTNGTLTLSTGTKIIINNTGSALTAGSYKIISKAANGSVGLVAGNMPVGVYLSGASTTAAPWLQIINGELYLNIGSTTIALSSSAPINGYLAPLSFTAAVQTNGATAGAATGTVTFMTNGSPASSNSLIGGEANSPSLSNLPRGTNIISAIYSGDSNYLAATNTMTQIVTNHPPVANNGSYTRNAAVNQIKIAITNLLSNATDVDGDRLSLVGVSTSTNLVMVTVSNGYVMYYNTNAVTDQFTYTVSDGFGGTNSAIVTINVDSTPLFGQSTLAGTTGGTATLNFAGIPTYGYSVLRSTNLTDWAAIWTTNAPADGLFQYIDLVAPQPSAYYRVQFNP